MIRLKLAALAMTFGFLAATAPALFGAGPGYEPWTFQEDFTQGIPGWLGFPLSQDVGYDPSIYTETQHGSLVLVRDKIAYGERIQRVGMVRPLRFYALPASSFHLEYDFSTDGKVRGGSLILGTTDGKRFGHALPFQPGAHDARITGQQLGFPADGADVEIIVLEAEVAGPSFGSHTLLTLRSLGIQAETPIRLQVRAPQLDRSSVDDVAVARQVVECGKPFRSEVTPGAAAEISIYDDAGRLETARNAAASPTGAIEVIAPEKPGLYQAKITSPEGEAEYDFLALGNVPPHPRVLLTAKRLDQLRSQSYSNDLLAIIHRRAGELRKSLAYNPHAGNNILQLPTYIIHPGIPQYFNLMEGYSNSIAFNALDFRISGDREALDAARRGLLTVSQWPTWTPPWFIAKGMHTYYEVGIFTQKVAFGYDLIADELSPEEKSTVGEAFWKFSILPTLQDYFLNDRLPIDASNHQAHSLGGAVEACVALYGDLPDWSTRFGPALAELTVAYERLLHGLFPGDGSEAEPAGYENFAMEGLSWGMAALHALNVRPHGYEDMMQGFWWLEYAQVRPDLLLDTGDFDGELKGHSGYAWGAEFAGDPSLQAFYQTATDLSLMGVIEVHDTGRALEEAPGLLDLVCCTRTVSPSPVPPSRIFPVRGSAVLRSGWTPDDTVISIRVGPWFNHEHHDQGSFQVAAYGEKLIAEAGYANYYQDPFYPLYFTQAAGHNTLVLDGDAFSQEDYDGRYWPAFKNFAKFTGHVFSPGADYLSADLAPAYADGAQLSRLTRDYVFVKPSIFVVHDRVESAAPHAYTWLLHIPPDAQTGTDAAQAVIRRPKAFAELSAAGDNTRWKIESQPVPTIDYKDFDRIPVYPRFTYRLDSPSERATDFLVAMHLQKAGEEAAPLQPLSTANGEGFRDTASNATVLFRSKPGPLTLGNYSTDGAVLADTNRNGVEEILSANVSELQRDQRPLIESHPGADIALRESPSLTEIYVSCSAGTELKFLPDKPVAEMLVDGNGISLRSTAGPISWHDLARGDHIVTIRY